MEIRRLDPADDGLLRHFVEILDSADSHERPWATHYSLEEMAMQLRLDLPHERWEAHGAFTDVRMVGAALTVLPMLDNTDKVYASIHVPPAVRRRGTGTALVDHVVSFARSHGRTLLMVDSGIPFAERERHPYRLFADRTGFTLASVEVHRVLELPVPEDTLVAMQAECAPHHGDYEIRTFLDDIPEELLESYCHLLGLLAVDAPTGEIDFEAEVRTPAVFREKEKRRREIGWHRLSTIAVTSGGEAVAHTDLVVPAEDRPKVYQWGTLVRRDHRGRHLGAAVKVANLRELQRRFPDRRTVHTTNEESNATMIGINERLGFRPVEICPEFVLRLAPA